MTDSKHMDQYKKKFKCNGCLGNINSKIWLFWKEDFSCGVIQNNEQSLTEEVTHVHWNCAICLTLVYASCSAIERKIL